MAAAQGESDEEFARRLQAEELGGLRLSFGGNRNSGRPASRLIFSSSPRPNTNYEASTNGDHHRLPTSDSMEGEASPMHRNADPTTTNTNANNTTAGEGGGGGGGGGDHNENQRRASELNGMRISLFAILTVNVPQIIAAIIILCIHWYDTPVCDITHQIRWNLWATASAIRMAVYSLIVSYIVYYKDYLEENEEELRKINNWKNITDAVGLIWFVVGNMWLFGDDDMSDCKHPDKSPVYRLCAVMLLINYIQICLPCIIAVTMIPVFCFCMPCLIRILARLHGGNLGLVQSQGATDSDINNLPMVIVAQEHLDGDDEKSCPICLSEFAIGEEARLLRCKHMFHKACVDEWLHVNATCPTCRMPIFENAAGTGESNDVEMQALTTQSTPVV